MNSYDVKRLFEKVNAQYGHCVLSGVLSGKEDESCAIVWLEGVEPYRSISDDVSSLKHGSVFKKHKLMTWDERTQFLVFSDPSGEITDKDLKAIGRSVYNKGIDNRHAVIACLPSRKKSLLRTLAFYRGKIPGGRLGRSRRSSFAAIDFDVELSHCNIRNDSDYCFVDWVGNLHEEYREGYKSLYALRAEGYSEKEIINLRG